MVWKRSVCPRLKSREQELTKKGKKKIINIALSFTSINNWRVKSAHSNVSPLGLTLFEGGKQGAQEEEEKNPRQIYILAPHKLTVAAIAIYY